MTYIPDHPVHVVLGRTPSDNGYCAVIEQSFSMDFSKDRALMFQTCKMYSFLGEHDIDGLKDDLPAGADIPEDVR